MTNRDEANKLASKITGETVNAGTTKEALEAISGKKAGTIAQAIDDIVKGDIPGGDTDLEDNKTATIDVSEYTEPVEITPTEGKDGMKKATVTLSNIPSGGEGGFYKWQFGPLGSADVDIYYCSFNKAPADITALDEEKRLYYDGSDIAETTGISDEYWSDYQRVSDTKFTYQYEGDDYEANLVTE